MSKPFLNLFDHLDEGVQVINSEFECVYINTALVNQINISKENILKKRILEIFPIIEKDNFNKKVKLCMNQRKGVDFVGGIALENGKNRWLEMKIKPFQEGVLIISSDVTEMKKIIAELEIKEEESQLEKQNHQFESIIKDRTVELSEALKLITKLSKIKKTFLSKNAHNLKNPLGYIKLSVDVLDKMSEHDDPEDRQKYHEYIKKEANDLIQLIDGLFNPIKEEIGKGIFNFESFNLSTFLENIIQAFQAKPKTQVPISISKKDKEIVQLDKAILQRIIINLIKKIIQYSDQEITLNYDIQERNVVIKISTKGMSISKSQQEKIFHPFLRNSEEVKNQVEDHELEIIKNYVTLMGGIIRVKIEEEYSAVFTIFLPT